MDKRHFDIIVVGTGGGAKLIRPAAQMGYKVAVIERDKLGGTCLNRGCIPSKMLIHAADVASTIRESERFDVRCTGDIMVNFSKLVKRVNATIDAESQSIEPLYENDPNVTLIRGEARFVAEKTIMVDGVQISADRIFLPVGAKATIPDIPGLADTPFLTYREALRLTKKPKKMIVLGGGYIALELGYFFAALGVDVEFYVRSKMLRNEDEEVGREFERVFSAHHNVHFGKNINRVDYGMGEFRIEDSAGETKTCDALLITTGVKPMTEELDLPKAGVKTDDKGYIVVDDRLRTSADGVWAFGDVTGHALFRHMANFEGEYLFKTLFQNPQDVPIEYPPIPHAVFSRPQIGGVGKTEEELKKDGVDYVVGKCPYHKSGMGMALLSDHGFVKLLFDRASRKLLGAHIIGEEASNMVHMPIAYMNMGATLDDMLSTIYIHPALPELVRNACRDAKNNLNASVVANGEVVFAAIDQHQNGAQD